MATRKRRDDDGDDPEDYDDEEEPEDEDDDDDEADDGDEVVILRGRRADRFLEQYGQNNGGDSGAGRAKTSRPAAKRARRPAGQAARSANNGDAERSPDRRPRRQGYFGDR